MELENIVANTVYLKAREGKLRKREKKRKLFQKNLNSNLINSFWFSYF